VSSLPSTKETRVITDGRSLSDGSIITSDLCIIGAGPAGIALALEFLGTGVEVVLLESGGLKWNEKKQNLADFEIEGPPYFVPKETRVRALGGTSNAWGGVCTPYDPVDFEERPWVANSGWPIAFNDLSPFYVRALRLSAAEDGPQTDNTGDDSSNEIVWSELNFSTSSRFGIRYRASIRNAANIRCLLNSTVTELISHPETRKITEVSVASRPARRFSVKAQVYVLACGGIENARLLLASNGTSPNGVGNEHDAVGRYFMEHPRIKDNFAIRKSSSILAATFPGVVGKTGFSRVQLSDSIQREEKLLNYHANISLGFVGQDSLQWEALRRIAFAIRKPENPYFPSGDGGPNRLRLKDIATTMARPDRTLASAVSSVFSPRSMQRWVEVVSTVEQPPLPHNRVVLS
jgi:choline dehydrogenase-like flavoprotein